MQAAINAAGNLLPADLPAPPIYAKVNPADAPIMTLAVTSKTLQLTDVEDLADTRLAEKISQLPGVGLVSISGGQRPAVRIRVKPQALAAYGLNIDDIRTTIGNLNVNTPKGNFDGPTQSLDDQRQRPDDRRRRNTAAVVIAYRNGTPVRLSDVADIVSGAGEYGAGRLGEPHAGDHPEHPAPAGRQRHRSGERREGAAAADRAPGCRRRWTVSVLSDRTTTIRASVADVEFELTAGDRAGGGW